MKDIPQGKRPPTFSDPLYIIQFFIVPLIGFFVAYAYFESGTPLSPMLTIHIGVSAPLIIKSFATAIPSIGSQKVD